MNSTDKYISFFNQHSKSKLAHLESLSGSGSNRKYFRVFDLDGNTYILTENSFVEENISFLYFNSKLFPTPKILGVNEDQTMYLQQDLGDENLLSIWQKNGATQDMYALWEKTLLNFAQMQINLKSELDYSKCYDFQVFDEKVVLNDLFYFKNFFLDRLDIPYAKGKLINEFQQIANDIRNLPKDYFLYRDFQSRNVMIYQNEPYFIDFQGGMRGFIGYDLVSFIHQAKAGLSQVWKEKLKNAYFKVFIEKENLLEQDLEKGYEMGMIMRYFQLLGAYGLRGLIEGKTHFKESLLIHLQQMSLLLEMKLLEKYPELEKVTKNIIKDELGKKIEIMLS